VEVIREYTHTFSIFYLKFRQKQMAVRKENTKFVTNVLVIFK